ncbi:MFS transporter [Lactobacillus paracasei subsp. paracasei]|uniref:MFS transporter n=1 Tax=Lacticaseibacillus paracasei TaxID=1597 RepID=UPI0018C70466|nr:MFS transporter [Lacticaseibacillus paracasei]MBG1274139.1 MFS transporter [Lacticaseibacillus paracasei subsp. paracasei]
MKTKRNHFLPGALALYFSYAMLGIASSILSQYKAQFASNWGAQQLSNGTVDVSMVVSVIAAFGLGRLIAYPFAGPVSDHFGRKVSGTIGIGLYVIFFIGIITVNSFWAAYLIGILNGMANSFLDTCVSPSLMEMFPESASIANLLTKFAVVTAQFILPFFIGGVAAAGLSFRTIFIICGVALAADAIAIIVFPFPKREKPELNAAGTPEKMHFSIGSVAAILIGFTSSTTFMVWLNCNQELGAAYGVKNPATLQSLYAVGAGIAVLLTARLIKAGLKESTVLILYPTIAVVMLALCYFVQTPVILYIGSFVIGYAAAGGVLQLATSTTISFFPSHKGTATSLVMIASSIANYAVLSAAVGLTKAFGDAAPRMIILLNIVITIVGIGLALVVKTQEKHVLAVSQVH